MVATSTPKQCGRGSVHRKWRLAGLKARTVPSEQPQKIKRSVTERQVAWEVCAHDHTNRSGQQQLVPSTMRNNEDVWWCLDYFLWQMNLAAVASAAVWCVTMLLWWWFWHFSKTFSNFESSEMWQKCDAAAVKRQADRKCGDFNQAPLWSVLLIEHDDEWHIGCLNRPMNHSATVGVPESVSAASEDASLV